MKKGDVWRVRIPPAPGHTQAGERPAITSKLAASRFGGTLVIQPDLQNGLTAPSVALVFQVRALDQRDCLKQIGTLDAATLDKIFDLLDQLTSR
jgi:mRNA interferase MazF